MLSTPGQLTGPIVLPIRRGDIVDATTGNFAIGITGFGWCVSRRCRAVFVQHFMHYVVCNGVCTVVKLWLFVFPLGQFNLSDRFSNMLTFVCRQFYDFAHA